MHQNMIDTIKKQYTRDVRKQVVKSMLKAQKSGDKYDLETAYKSIDQIFSYVIGEIGWKIASSTKSWDTAPLGILKECFPKIETTQWFKDKQLDMKNLQNEK